MKFLGDFSRRAVCFMDVLGFKKMIEMESIREVAVKYETFLLNAESTNTRYPINSEDYQLFPDHGSGKPYCIQYIFSDSIILLAHDDNAESCRKLLVYAWRLLQTSLAQRLSIRGAVAYGDVYINPERKICLGSGLTAAYQLEQKQQWVGVTIDPSVEIAYPELFTIELHPGINFDAIFLKYPVPLKDGSFVEARTLNWRFNLAVESGTRWLFPPSDEPSAQQKIANTLSYANKVKQSGLTYNDQAQCPIELRTYFIGEHEPPFSHGDDL